MTHALSSGFIRRRLGERGALVLEMSNRSRRELARRGAQLPHDEQDRMPPGGVLIIATLAGVSGALMGFLFAGALSLVVVGLLALGLGIYVGFCLAS